MTPRSQSAGREIKFRMWNGVMHSVWFEIDPDRLKADVVLMQYTGLKDKNGKEIYEGDIVKAEDFDWGLDGNYQIKWGGDYPAFDIFELSGKSLDVEYNILSSDPDIEVIGNIYENPELLSPPQPIISNQETKEV
jgi:uncharacterized phage protein (TIGR01671 family)